MTSWAVAISALVAGAGMAMRSAIPLVVAIWSLRADEDGRQHAIRLLEVLQSGRLTAPGDDAGRRHNQESVSGGWDSGP